MTRDEMWHKACKRFEEWACKYADKSVTDAQFFNELCCSIYSGLEFEDPRELCKLQWLEYEREFKQEYMYTFVQKQTRDDFFAQIGEALGPVCYAAWRFKQSFNKGTNTDWIDKCIKYYEDHVEELV